MDLKSKDLECQLIKTLLLQKNKKAQDYILSEIKDDYLATEEAVEIFNLIKKYREKGITQEVTMPSFELIKSDMALSDNAKIFLDREVQLITKKTDIKIIFEKLDTFRKNRHVYSVLEHVTKRLKQKNVNIDDVTDYAVTHLQQLNTTTDVNIFSFDNEEHMNKGQESIFNPKKKNEKIKTGLTEFDTKTGGFSTGHLIIIAGPTGGGKSVLGIQIASNMAIDYGKRVCYISLEMDNEEVYQRIMASRAGVLHEQMGKQTKYTAKIQARIINTAAAITKTIREKNAALDIWCPVGDFSPTELINKLSLYHYDCIFIDYIGLLNIRKEYSGATEAQGLTEATRQFKLAAGKLGCAIVTLAQFDQEHGRLKYSRGMKENVNIMWQWELPEDVDDRPEYVDIVQVKARGSSVYNFKLKPNFAYMRWENPPDVQQRMQEYERQIEEQLENSFTEFETNEEGQLVEKVEDEIDPITGEIIEIKNEEVQQKLNEALKNDVKPVIKKDEDKTKFWKKKKKQPEPKQQTTVKPPITMRPLSGIR